MPRAGAQRRLAFASAAVIVTLACLPAHAQVHYDLGVIAGANEHFLFNRPAAENLPTPGPALTLDGHVAVFPLLRVGGYVTGDVTDLGAPSPRWTLGGGLRLKVIPPWPRGKWRAWLATGVGYVGAYSFTSAATAGAGGGALEIPVALGGSYRFRKPWVVILELTTRFGFGFWGSLYDTRGTDVITVGLGVGLGIDS